MVNLVIRWIRTGLLVLSGAVLAVLTPWHLLDFIIGVVCGFAIVLELGVME